MTEEQIAQNLEIERKETHKEIRRLKNQVALNFQNVERLGWEVAQFRRALEGLLERFGCDDAVDECVFNYAEGVLKKHYAGLKSEGKEVRDAIEAIRSESEEED
jgi:hypothetical protein